MGRKTCCGLVIFKIKLKRNKEKIDGRFQMLFKTKRRKIERKVGSGKTHNFKKLICV